MWLLNKFNCINNQQGLVLGTLLGVIVTCNAKETQILYRCLIIYVYFKWKKKKRKTNWDINLCPYGGVTGPWYFKGKPNYLTWHLNQLYSSLLNPNQIFSVFVSEVWQDAMMITLQKSSNHIIVCGQLQVGVHSLYQNLNIAFILPDFLMFWWTTNIISKFQPCHKGKLLIYLIYHVLWNTSDYAFYPCFLILKRNVEVYVLFF